MFEGATAKLQDARTAIDRLRALVLPATESNIKLIGDSHVIDTSGGLKVDLHGVELPRPAGEEILELGTDDPVAFAEAFSSSVAHVRAVGDAILKDRGAARLPGFPVWRAAKKELCCKDELLQFINNRRNSDLHEGDSPLRYVMYATSFSTRDVGAPPQPKASLLIGGSGAYWLVEKDTPRERRVPCTGRTGYRVTVAVHNPPASHQGQPLRARDPLSLCVLAEHFYSDLLFEAKSKFGK